jgi:hypothetical protein
MNRILLILCCCGILVSSCSKSSNPVSATAPSDSTTFPNHFFFEKNSQPSLNGWIYNPAIAGDTANFDADAPIGGIWSLKLHKADTPHGSNNVTRTFTNLTSGVYKLTSWVKIKYAVTPGTFPEGFISIAKESGNNSYPVNTNTGDSVSWHPISVFDTLSLVSTDKVTIMLSAGAADTTGHGNPVWFDNITFVKL